MSDRYRDQYALASSQLNELCGLLLRVLKEVGIKESTGELWSNEGDEYDMRDLSDAVSAMSKIHKAERDTLRVLGSSGKLEGVTRSELIEDVDSATG